MSGGSNKSAECAYLVDVLVEGFDGEQGMLVRWKVVCGEALVESGEVVPGLWVLPFRLLTLAVEGRHWHTAADTKYGRRR